MDSLVKRVIKVGHAVGYQAKAFVRSQVRLLIAIHAAAITDGQGCVLIAGPCGAGKTTLTAALLKEGYGYLTEDTTLIDRSTRNIIPSRASLCVKEGSWNVVSELYPAHSTLPVQSRLEGTPVRYLPPSDGAISSADQTDPFVKGLVFTKHRDDQGTSLKRIPRIDAIRKLEEAGYEVSDGFSNEEFQDFLTWYAQVETYEITVNSLPEAVSLVGRILKR